MFITFSEVAKKMHCWLKKPPKNCTPLEGVNVILLGINGSLISDLIMPDALSNLNNNIANNKFVIPIIGIMLSVLLWGFVGILETSINKKIEIPIKYKFSLLLLFIPLLILVDKLLARIMVFNKNYEKQNNTNN
jgi:hypothetical protein